MKVMLMLAVAAVLTAAAGTGPAAAPADMDPVQQFDHVTHEALFSSCEMCHSVGAGGVTYPDASFCAGCHNGQMQPRVSYTPPTFAPSSNLKFRHDEHPPVACASCHLSEGASAMSMERPVVDNCLACHGVQASHKEAPDSPCQQCHVQMPAPEGHAANWLQKHGDIAASEPGTCGSCHVRADCLECHRPGAASPAPGYHTADYLTAHPAQAYAREADCSSCHNVGQFCQDCHLNAGLATQGVTASRAYHDANPSFSTGHGQAARQSLESCVACHNEGDCVRCHFNANPHGPDFDADRIASRNPTSCVVCHVGGIPGTGGG